MNKSKISGSKEEIASNEYESNLLSFTDNFPVSVTDNKGIIVYVNDLFANITQYSASELVGQNHRILKSGHHPTDFFEALWREISKGHIWHGVIKNMAKDGSHFFLDTVIIPNKDNSGKITNYISIRNSLKDSEVRK